MELNNTKICSCCKNEYPLENFRKGSGKMGKKNYCISCDDMKNKTLYEKNKQKRISQVTLWNSLNPDTVKLNQKNWRENNK